MKNLMSSINSILFLGSVVGIVWHLVGGQFGIAWIAAACAAFNWCNFYAIGEE